MKYIKTLSSKKYFKWVFVLFILSIILIENKWFGQAHFKEVSGGLQMIDMNFYNSAETIDQYLTTLGEKGRSAYQLLLYLDFGLIATLFLFLSTKIYRLLDKTGLLQKFNWLLLLPFARSVFDIIETSAMLANTTIFPNDWLPLLYLAEISTPLKWGFLFATVIASLSLMIFNLVNQLKTKQVIPGIISGIKSKYDQMELQTQKIIKKLIPNETNGY